MQTYKDWECIIVDGYSDNGSWEILKDEAVNDKRFRPYQFKKEGIYKAWNSGIKLAVGEYVYIATSDDTMTDDCIEKLVLALNTYPKCDIAHCCLTIIDESGKPSEKENWDQYYPTQYFNGLMKEKHIRLAPYDGILHCGIKTVYSSITQLLIRSSVFKKVGLFLTQHGSIADFEWGMRAGLVCNILHIPEYLATWRQYDGQATTSSLQRQHETYRTLRYFINHAVEANCIAGLLDCNRIDLQELQVIYLKEEFRIRLDNENIWRKKLQVCLEFFLINPFMVVKQLFRKLFKMLDKGNVSLVREMIARYKLQGHIEVL